MEKPLAVRGLRDIHRNWKKAHPLRERGSRRGQIIAAITESFAVSRAGQLNRQ
jgi:hypothetical protein